jgi:hypothetical protein
MQTVIETPAFLASVKDEGISDEERMTIVNIIASDPAAGAIMKGTGGARKVRIARRGGGKSGGYRVITFFADEEMPVFLLDVYSKDSQANLSPAERNELRSILTDLPRVWRENQRRAGEMRKRK